MKRGCLLFWALVFLAFAGFTKEPEKIFPRSDKSHSLSKDLEAYGTNPGNFIGNEDKNQAGSVAKIFLGEKMKFEVRYVGIPVGEAVSEVKELVKMNGRDVYHVEIQIRSGSILDWVYKVRDTHHTYIDAEHFYSLRYEKKIKEGRYWTDELMEYDQDAHLGRFYSHKDHSRKEMFIPKNVQDQISCGYWMRLQNIQPDSKFTIAVNADEKNWDLQVITHGVKEMKLDGVGVFEAVEVEPLILFEGFFVRRGKVHGWMSLDERHIPLMMKVKVPVLGEVTAVLVQYEPGSGA